MILMRTPAKNGSYFNEITQKSKNANKDAGAADAGT
jgi:hypothetical protein